MAVGRVDDCLRSFRSARRCETISFAILENDGLHGSEWADCESIWVLLQELGEDASDQSVWPRSACQRDVSADRIVYSVFLDPIS